MKTTSPAFPLLGGDWLKGTARLSASERGYYLDLLLYTWDSDEPLPADEREQMQIARCTSRAEWRKVWARLRTKWFTVDGGYRNRRCEEERVRLKGYRDRKSHAGKAGAEKRWHSDGATNGKPIADAIAEGAANGWPSISSSEETDSKNQSQSPAPTRELLKLFDELHEQRFEAPAEINGAKDGAIMAVLARKRGVDAVQDLIRAFFKMRDPWVLQRGFSVGVFKTQIPKLLAQVAPPEPKEHWSDECKRLHNGACDKRTTHELRVARDARQAVS